MEMEGALNFVVEKLKQLWLAVENFWGQFLEWFDKVFPPGSRPQWLPALLIAAVAAVALTFLICCCRKCGCCRRGCCGRRRGYFKMMKAPGRDCLMPRHKFEADPRSYFQRLRAYPGDELC